MASRVVCCDIVVAGRDEYYTTIVGVVSLLPVSVMCSTEKTSISARIYNVMPSRNGP
jgi:hypothetical protein